MSILTRTRPLDRYATVPFFRGWGRADLVKFDRHAETVTFRPGEVLTTHSGYRCEFIVLLTGQASLRHGNDGSPARWLGPGDFVGALELLADSSGGWTAVADSTCTALLLGPRQFRGLLADSPRFSEQLAKSLAHQLVMSDTS